MDSKDQKSGMSEQVALNEKWAALPVEEQAPYIARAEAMLTDLLCCTRDWSAWGVETMSEHDFVDAAGDSDLVGELAEDFWRVASGGMASPCVR